MAPDGYECVPPEDVRAELRGRGRPSSPEAKVDTPPTPPPVRPSSPVKSARGWSNWHGSALAALGLVLAAVVITAELSRQPAPPVTPVPVSTPKASVTPVLAPQTATPVLPPAPRAQLVRLPTQQQSLTDLSPAHIDESHDIMMPYGTVVRATLRGFLEQESQLPKVGRIGDMFMVGTMPWIWIQVPGTTAPTWIDP